MIKKFLKKICLEEIKDLRESIAILCERVDKLESNLKNQKEVFEFVEEYGRDGISYDLNPSNCKMGIRYINNDKVCEAVISPILASIKTINVIESDCFSAIIEIEFSKLPFRIKLDNQYYKLDKLKNTCVEIPKPASVLEKELAEKEASKKKSTSAKKDSEKK